ncbi:MAG: hypothetical protein KJ018_16965 [Burkholderiales bacterium]|nr:hypothetical protein [Burkholderiales bacterium]
MTPESVPGIESVFEKETLVRGAPAHIRCTRIAGQTYAIENGPARIVRLEDEWYEDVADPAGTIAALSGARGVDADLFTFWQRMPETKPRFDFHVEWEEIAVLPVQDHAQWFEHRIKSRVRNQIRKSAKEGLVVREVAYDDDFVRGMTAIFNESPTRQGRPFWHYGKDFSTVRRQFSRFIHRERMIGAYLGEELVGFMMLANAGRFALVGQLLSSLHHRDRLPNQALMSKAVEVCADWGLPYLIYLFWTDDTLAEFKRRCGFERVLVPRYWIPLSSRGRLALRLGLHRGVSAALPPAARSALKRLRSRWYDLRSRE